MRPIRLEIEGLTSFREKQIIDFSDLDLFVITGPTGSGKSSILDAISLSLYGRVPRMGGQGNRELVSHGVSHVRVRLAFRAGEHEFEVARRLPARGVAGQHQATLERLENGERIPEVLQGGVGPVDDRIVEIVGLDFDAFTRTVLLPQGEFAAFMAGDQRKRRDILIRLLDLGRYQHAAQIAGAEATQLFAEAQAAERQVATQYEGIDEQALAAARATREAAGLAQAQAVEAQQALNRLAVELAEAAGSASGAAAIDQEFAAAGGRIGRHAADFVAIEPEEKAATATAERATAALADAMRHRDETVVRLAETLQRTGDETRLADLEAALRTCSQEDTRLRELGVRRLEAAADMARGAVALDAARAAAAEAERVEAAAGEADVVAQERREVARAERAAAQNRMNAEAEFVVAEAEFAAAATGGAAADLSLAAAMADAVAAQAHLDHVESEDEAASFRTRLAVGEPCPVCRHVVTVMPVATAPDGGVAEAQRMARSAAARHQHAIGEATRGSAVHRAAASRLAASQGRLAALPAAAPFADADRAWRTAEEAAAETSLRRHGAADIRRAREQAQLAAHGTNITATAARDAVDREIVAARARRQAVFAGVEAAFAGAAVEKAAEQVTARRQELAAARSASAAGQSACDKAQDALNGAAASLRSVAARAAAVGDRAMQEWGTVNHLLARGATVVELALLPDARGGDRSSLQLLADVVAVARVRLRETVETLKARREQAEARLRDGLAAFGIQPHTLVASDVQAATARFVMDAALRLQAAEAAATRLASDLAIKSRLETEAAEKRRAATLHQTLATALQANNFIDFILAESVQRLAAIASTELKSISGGRYSLKARDIGFLVIDHANADEERSVSTLSGGETFLASLALATALARSVTDIAGAAMGGRLEAMFIDEGFGTLDPEALDMVVDALERLRDTNRLVGIITHVAALSERIPDGLVVERTGNSSRVLVRA